MTDLTAFDRQLSGEISGLMGPVRPVDDLAVYESVIAANRQHRWGFGMFSALKFVAAAAVVALFGGFLLTGVLNTPQSDEVPPAAVSASPTTEATSEPTEPTMASVRTDILPGVELTVEEVDPGVYRVVNDGVRDLTSKNNWSIVAGHDGGLWALRQNRFFRLGSDTAHKWAAKTRWQDGELDFEVAPDGTVWTVQGIGDEKAIQSLDGEEWTAHMQGYFVAVEVTPDGTVWAKWSAPESDTWVFGYLDSEGWQPVGEALTGGLFVPGTGDIWATRGGWHGLNRFIDGEWHGTDRAGPVVVGLDGTVWAEGSQPESLSRFDGSEWQEWPLAGSHWFRGLRDDDVFAVAPDGSLWVGKSRVTVTDDEKVCRGGVGNFDGTVRSEYLPDLCVKAMDIAADGSVWLLASEKKGRDEPLHLYVITPEAESGSEQ